MEIVGSIIARLGSKRLRYKNILPFAGLPMVGLGISKLRQSRLVTKVVVSTESELVARIAFDFGATILRRPAELAEDNVPSVPVFQHLVRHFPCDVHVNLNVNFPRCEPALIDRAIEIAIRDGESLSVPYAVWAQRRDCLEDYGDPWTITATRFSDTRAGNIDVHTEEDLLQSFRDRQGPLPGWDEVELSETLSPGVTAR